MADKKTIIGYKFITDKMESRNGTQSWKIGKWYKHKGKLELCKEGFHACETPLQALQYVYGDRWFIVEARGQILKQKDDKFVASEMRLIKEIYVKAVAMRFSCIAARSCLKNFEVKYPKDDRVRKAIEAAELYIEYPTEKNREAARSAAWSAESAARSAAWSAAWSAARSAAWSAESAERSAVSAAWSAERSAVSAARSAAWSAARSAAWSAESAARSGTKKHLNSELEKLIKKHTLKRRK
jgi:hypothetical protein